MVLCSVQIPDPARSRHEGCIYPLPSPDSPHSQSPLGAPLPSEGARARVPRLEGLSSGPAAPARLPGCGRCLLRLCPEPRHRSRRDAQPPRGSGAFQWYRSHPGHQSLPRVPEPPAGTGGAELPGCGATQRDHLCCRERLLCSRIYSWSKQDPKMRVRLPSVTAKTRNVQCVVEKRARSCSRAQSMQGTRTPGHSNVPTLTSRQMIPVRSQEGKHPEQHHPGVHSPEGSGPPARAGRTGHRARLNEPGPRARGSLRDRGEPPLPFLQRGIIAAHDAAGVIAAGVIAAGLGASAAPALSPRHRR
ncbi:uncharacterized protein LOC132331781 isoform X1 [Haemorhous mexicanus]|uniref:uncharacterized protein LOC132331781 isoform X1 n=1 Tax=Haemorhous mexicanus TaxID=30427 RepID=UPI0028BEEF74|nr:uncharacterized protein LOC132331781 isoform X1 [Haemorhous mexicanus]